MALRPAPLSSFDLSYIRVMASSTAALQTSNLKGFALQFPSRQRCIRCSWVDAPGLCHGLGSRVRLYGSYTESCALTSIWPHKSKTCTRQTVRSMASLAPQLHQLVALSLGLWYGLWLGGLQSGFTTPAPNYQVRCQAVETKATQHFFQK